MLKNSNLLYIIKQIKLTVCCRLKYNKILRYHKKSYAYVYKCVSCILKNETYNTISLKINILHMKIFNIWYLKEYILIKDLHIHIKLPGDSWCILKHVHTLKPLKYYIYSQKSQLHNAFHDTKMFE